MSDRTLFLEIVTPDGRALSEAAVDAVVVRRQEPRFEVGSEIAVFPLHAPMLVRLAVAPLRYRKGSETVYLAVAGGFAEVRRDRVLVVTPRCELIARETASPATAAGALCREWARTMGEFRAEMVGAGSLVALDVERHGREGTAASTAAPTLTARGLATRQARWVPRPEKP